MEGVPVESVSLVYSVEVVPCSVEFIVGEFNLGVVVGEHSI